MLTTKYCETEIDNITKTIESIKKQSVLTDAQKAYIEHITRLREEYRKEMIKSLQRPEKPIGNEPDQDYILFFSRDGRFV